MTYYVYIVASKTRRLYIGMTNNLLRRVWEHKSGSGSVFTSKYKMKQLVYFESTNEVRAAIEREKEMKLLLRSKKVALIEGMNPDWNDLAADWYDSEMAEPE
jgi:putative endonuclease